MQRHLSVAISSAGRRVGLVECLRADADRLGLALRIVAFDARPELSAACAVADAAYAVPPCADAEFIPRVCDIVRREDLTLIIPTIDTELQVYADAVPLLASHGARVSVSSPACVAIARNKLLTAEVLQGAGVAIPATMRLSAYLAQRPDWPLPLVIKPIDGSSSIGLRRVASRRDLDSLDVDPEAYVAQEYLQGLEYTVNMFFDSGSRLRCAIPHQRIETRGGEVSKGRTERVPSLHALSVRVASSLPGPHGALCYQALATPEGEFRVIEINARFGGGFPLAHSAGARFTQWLLEECAGLPSSACDDWRAGLTMLRYDAGVFVEASGD